MSRSTDGTSRAGSLKPLPEAQFRAIQSVQNRLDEAEAELAAVVSMAQRRGAAFLHEMAEPLLDELDHLVVQLRHLMLEDGARPACRSESRPAGRVIPMNGSVAHRRASRA